MAFDNKKLGVISPHRHFQDVLEDIFCAESSEGLGESLGAMVLWEESWGPVQEVGYKGVWGQVEVKHEVHFRKWGPKTGVLAKDLQWEWSWIHGRRGAAIVPSEVKLSVIDADVEFKNVMKEEDDNFVCQGNKWPFKALWE
ncbi:hypothetical protein PAXRUDRAFT_28565 [Paxillus rubicundulus Ve08.2h10]|uniref:Uncharacterized protein n=1 Tax=Paxillus rubicundulus Ve08.2h10 TaxID=930991 RepID=A0A0D0DDB6_9AGAM|nr:hypothetical protein PAXRUDRAFT_28565 [Paxillus rubicundulus Ve08.2h10]